MDLPLTSLFRRALNNATKAFHLPTIEDETQDLLQSALSDLTTARIRVASLALFSPNETLPDISTRDLVYLFVSYALAEVENRARTTDSQERIARIRRAQAYLKEFIPYLANYGIVPESERQLYERKTSAIGDPAKRRDLKIKQYQKEKEIRAKIESIHKRWNQSPSSEPSSGLELIVFLLPSSSPLSSEEEDSETDEIIREATLLLLRLTYAQAQSSLESLEQELELLRHMPAPSSPSADERRKPDQKAGQDDMWKLDAPIPRGGPDGKGPLLDPSGKPLRPFTILPAGASDRARLHDQVFQADHRLPTMSIDQYLEIEQQRGNIISGGGPESQNRLTTSEQLQLDSEMDGTIFGGEKAEEKRQKDEQWAQYTDANPKGAGNTMNKG